MRRETARRELKRRRWRRRGDKTCREEGVKGEKEVGDKVRGQAGKEGELPRGAAYWEDNTSDGILREAELDIIGDIPTAGNNE